MRRVVGCAQITIPTEDMRTPVACAPEPPGDRCVPLSCLGAPHPQATSSLAPRYLPQEKGLGWGLPEGSQLDWGDLRG